MHRRPDTRISVNQCESVRPLDRLTPSVGAVRKAAQEQWDVELLRRIGDGEDNL